MDNFFEIIIYLFIIASLVSSFRKKKKKAEEKVNRSENTEQEPQTTHKAESKREQSGKDILDEIQNLFNPPAAKPAEQTNTGFEDLWKTDSAQDHYKTSEYHAPIPTEHEVTTSEHVETSSEHNRSTYDSVRLPEQTVVERLLDDQDDQKENYKTRKPNELLMLIRDDMRNKDSLKRYIIFSEILGKPKALRR